MKKIASAKKVVYSKQHDWLLLALLTIVIVIGLVNLVYYLATYSSGAANPASAPTLSQPAPQLAAQGAVSLEIINPPAEDPEGNINPSGLEQN